MLRPRFGGKKKKSKQFSKLKTNGKNQIVPFFGVGTIVNEESDLIDIKCNYGEPSEDFIDERGNRILSYTNDGLSFKFLKILNKKIKNPVVSFITIKRPFKDKSEENIYPGLDKIDVQFRMKNNHPSEVKLYDEIWKDENGKKMKFTYDKGDKLETITIF